MTRVQCMPWYGSMATISLYPKCNSIISRLLTSQLFILHIRGDNVFFKKNSHFRKGFSSKLEMIEGLRRNQQSGNDSSARFIQLVPKGFFGLLSRALTCKTQNGSHNLSITGWLSFNTWTEWYELEWDQSLFTADFDHKCLFHRSCSCDNFRTRKPKLRAQTNNKTSKTKERG